MLDRIQIAFSALWTSTVRTGIPIVVSAVAGWLVSVGFPVDEELKVAISGFVGAIFGLLYYILIRVLERMVPKLGWLLGSPRVPVYVNPAVVTSVETAATIANESVEK